MISLCTALQQLFHKKMSAYKGDYVLHPNELNGMHMCVRVYIHININKHILTLIYSIFRVLKAHLTRSSVLANVFH